MDARRTLRFPLEESIAAVWMDNGRARRVVGLTRDISPGGVFLYLDHQPPTDGRIELILEFPSKVTTKQSSPVLCHGRVVRVESQAPPEKFGVAVEIESCADLAPASDSSLSLG
jgi:PilZ domain